MKKHRLSNTWLIEIIRRAKLMTITCKGVRK